MPVLQMITISSLCNGTLVPVKNFRMDLISAGLGMTRNSFLWPIFDDVMKKLIPSGILQHLLELYGHFMYEKYDWSPEQLPRILTLDDLAFGFILWLTACGISIAGFVAEFFGFLFHDGCKALVSWIKDFIGLIFLLFLIKNRLKEFK